MGESHKLLHRPRQIRAQGAFWRGGAIEGAERSERSEKSERSDQSDKIEASDKSSEKRDTSEKERGDRAERGERGERRERERGERGDRGSRGSSTSGKKQMTPLSTPLFTHPSLHLSRKKTGLAFLCLCLFVLTAWFQDRCIWCPLNVDVRLCACANVLKRLSVKEYEWTV